MDKKIKLLGVWGFAINTLLGTLLHFLYDWTNKAVWVAPFSGVNESTWEHMKLLFWPMLIFALIEWLFLRERDDLWCIKLRSILLGITLIPVLFYTYNGVIGESPDWANIAIFFISAFFAYLYEVRALLRADTKCRRPIFSLLLILLIASLFVIFTFSPPELGIFRDPITGAYGI